MEISRPPSAEVPIGQVAEFVEEVAVEISRPPSAEVPFGQPHRASSGGFDEEVAAPHAEYRGSTFPESQTSQHADGGYTTHAFHAEALTHPLVFWICFVRADFSVNPAATGGVFRQPSRNRW